MGRRTAHLKERMFPKEQVLCFWRHDGSMRHARIVGHRHRHADGGGSKRIKRECMSSFMEEMLRGEEINGLQLLIGHSAIMPDRIEEPWSRFEYHSDEKMTL